MKSVYETPVALLLTLCDEDVLTASGFEVMDEGDGDRIFITDL